MVKELEELELEQKTAAAEEEEGEEKHKQQSIEVVEESCDRGEEMDGVTEGVSSCGSTAIGNHGIRAQKGTESTVLERKEEGCVNDGEVSDSQIKEEFCTQEEKVRVYII